MAGRQAVRGLWLLMRFFVVLSWPRRKDNTGIISIPAENVGTSLPVHVLVCDAAPPALLTAENLANILTRDSPAQSSFHERGQNARKTLFKSRYALAPSRGRAPLFLVPGISAGDSTDARSLPGSQRSPLRQIVNENSAVPASTRQQVHTAEYAESPQEQPAVARSRPHTQTVLTDAETYDFIVIGCGAAGCPLASYLALKGEGRRVLVLERGLERTFEQTPRSMTIFSDGVAIADEAISQPYTTRKGVRTHVASVMGGGTAIDLAIYVEETKEYFDYLNKNHPAYKFQWPAIQQAYSYVRRVVARKMPQDTRFAYDYARALRARGFEPVGSASFPNYSHSIQVNKQWGSFSLFDVPQGGYRRAADVFLSELPRRAKKNIDVRTRHVVERVEFDKAHVPPRAKCVIYRPTAYGDIKPQGLNFGQTLPASSAGWGPWIGTFLAPATVLVGPQTPPAQRFFSQSNALRRVCLNDRKGSRIILSAGAINTAVLLYKSGIGPLQQLKEISAPVTVENPHVGTSFSDRVFIPVSAFTGNYADEITPVPSKPIRRMSLRTRSQDNRGVHPPALGVHRSASTGDHTTDASTFTHVPVRSPGEAAPVQNDRIFKTDGDEEANRREDTKEKILRFVGDRDTRQPDLIYRSTLPHGLGSSPIAALSRDIYEEKQSLVSKASTRSSPRRDTVPGMLTISEEGLTGNLHGANSEGDPIRVVLTDFKNTLSPEITGRFVDVRYPQEGLLSPPRVCQAMGLKQVGPPGGCDPENYKIGKRTLTCSLSVAEETSGGRSQEGVVLATRFVFPPVLRNDPFVDVLFEILGACGDYRHPYGIPLLQPLCAIIMPVIKCFRKALATFHFVAEPKSRGFVHLRSDGAIDVEGNYLRDEQDLFDAVRGASSLIEAMNGDAYRETVQATGSYSCPVTVLNGLLDLFLTVASTTSLFMTRKGNFAMIQNYLQNLLPERHRRLRRIIRLDKGVKPRQLVATAVEDLKDPVDYYQEGQKEPNKFILDDYHEFVVDSVDERKLEELGYKEKLKEVGFDFESYRRHLAGGDQHVQEKTEEPAQWFTARRVLQEMRRSQHDTASADVRKIRQSETPPGEPERLFTREQLKRAEETCKQVCSPTDSRNVCAAADVCCAAFGNSLCIRTPENEALERQLRRDLSKAFQSEGYNFTHSEDDALAAIHKGMTESSGLGKPCATGDDSCVLRAVQKDGFLPAVEEVWEVMERLPAAGATLVKSFLPGTAAKRNPNSAGTVESIARHPSTATSPTSKSSGSPQWAATFPPRLPDPYNPRDVARYALTYMSSVWHHCNTAPMGLVVNSDFDVIGTQGLSVVDASVMNKMTRMNPVATLLMMGVYAAMKKLQAAGVVDVLPPAEPSGNGDRASVTA